MNHSQISSQTLKLYETFLLSLTHKPHTFTLKNVISQSGTIQPLKVEIRANRSMFILAYCTLNDNEGVHVISDDQKTAVKRFMYECRKLT